MAVQSMKKSTVGIRSRSSMYTAPHLSMSDPTNSNRLKAKRHSPELERIESEYIRNLQQQIYFLELEANYLREQTRKATELQPQMSAEAKRMITRLRELQHELEIHRMGVKQKELESENMKVDKERMLGKLKAAEDSHLREKRLLLDEIGQLKKEKELLDRSLTNKEAEIADSRQHMTLGQSTARTSENKLRILETQLNQKSEQLKLVQQTVDEKRSELRRAEEKLHQTEEKYYSSSAMVSDKVKEDLREEIRLLRRTLKEMEMNVSHDRFHRNKLTDDSGQMMAKENARLNQHYLDLQLQLENVHGYRTSTSRETIRNATDYSSCNDLHHLKMELEKTKEELEHEQDKLKQLLKQEQLIKKQQLSSSTMQSRSIELTANLEKLTMEKQELRNEIQILLERVSDLQKQVTEKEMSIRDLEGQIQHLELKLKDLEHLQVLHSSVHSQKWEEFSHLAESMKSLSESMAHSSSSPKPWSTTSASSPTKLFDYS